MGSLKQMFESARQRIKEAYHTQPEILSVTPFKTSKKSLTKFSIEGVIIDTAQDFRKISNYDCKGGSSPHINIPEAWKTELTPPLVLHLFQTDKKGILIQEAEVKVE